MRVERDAFDDRIYVHLGRDTFAHAIWDWSQLRGKYNWLGFHFLTLYVERDFVAPGWEAEVAILGIGFRIRHTFREEWDQSELGQTLREMEPTDD